MQEYETSDKKVAIKCKKISDTLRNLTSGEETAFPLIQYDSVATGIQRLQRKNRALGWKWKTSCNDTSIVVTRVA